MAAHDLREASERICLSPAREEQQPPVVTKGGGPLFVAVASLSLGGAERIVIDWASRIRPDWQVHLIVLRDRKAEWPVPDFVKVTRLHGERLREQLREMSSVIADSGNPVCVCHLLASAERQALAAFGVHVITVIHNAQAGWLEDLTCFSGETPIIAVSEAAACDLRRSGCAAPISVIRHLPPGRRSSPGLRLQWRDAWRIPRNAVVIGMVGAVKPQKNYASALRLLKLLLERRDVFLVIVGGPVNTAAGRPAWEQVLSEIERLGVRHRVAMPGFVADAARCLCAFDLFLNTSHFEGLSIATLEALAHGLPAVVNQVGGQGEVASEGLTLIPPGADESVWLAAIEAALLTKPGLPGWLSFPSYRLWTLASLGRPVRSSGPILFVTANLSSGGAQRSLVNLALALAGEVDLRVAVAGRSSTPHFLGQLCERGIPVERTAEPWDAFAHAEALTRKICAEQLSVVCFWNVDARVKLLVVKTLAHTAVKFIDVSPGGYLYREMADTAGFQGMIAFPAEAYYQRLDTLVLKHSGEKFPRECLGRTVVIPNGVERPGRIKKTYEVSSRPKVVVNGRIAPTKFLLEILVAMKQVREVIRGAELHIFGAAEPLHRTYAESVLDAAADAVGEWVFFYGPRFDFDALADFDLFVVLGDGQGCPNALLEALALGLPAIANDSGGTGEQILHEETGLLIGSTSPEELRPAIIRLLGDRKLAAELGRAGRERALRTFSIDAMARRYSAILREDPGDSNEVSESEAAAAWA